MDYKFLFKSLMRIIFTPEKAWDNIIAENRPAKDLRNNYMFPMTGLVALAVFLGSIIFANTKLPAVYSVFEGLKYFVLILVVIYLSTIVLGEITKPFDLGRNFTTSFRLIVYSFTPLFFCLVASHLFESLIFVDILSLYGLYIFWVGAEKILSPPDYKKMPLLIIIFVFVIEMFIAVNWILTALTDRIFYSFFA